MDGRTRLVLAVNGGSSSVKYALFTLDVEPIGAPLISQTAARVEVRVIPTNEALMMAREAHAVLTHSASTI